MNNTDTYVQFARDIERFVDGALDDEIKKTIRMRALIAGLVMAIPLWGLEIIIYGICLWGTYKAICDISHVPFRENFFKNVLSGFITNLIVTFVLGLLMDLIPVVGWIPSFAMGFVSLYLSAMGYLKVLKQFHGNKLRTNVNFRKGYNNMKKNIYSKDTTIDKVINGTSRYIDNGNY